MDKLINWLKRPQVWGFFVSVAVMAIVSVAFFFPDNIDGNSLMQSDMQQGEANGHEAAAYEQATGEKALWTNSLMSGMPTFQISPSYPSNSLFTWLNDVYGLWLPVPSNLLFMMMLGFFILLYCMKMRWWYALIGAIAWGFSSYFVIIIGAGHIWKFVALSYIPPTIGGLVLCYRRRYVLGGALTALFAMLQLNANHPQMTYYFGFVMAGMAIAYLVDAVRAKQVKSWLIATAVVLGAGALALGANSPSLYNTYEYAKETKRSQSELTPLTAADETEPAVRPTGGMPYSEIVNWSYGKSESFSLLIPNIKGGATAKPQKGQMYALTLDRLDGAKNAPRDVSPVLPMFYQYFNDSEGTNGPVYVGALICALFLLGCFVVRGPMKVALLVLTILSLLLALGRNFTLLTDFMVYHFPMYSKFRAVESILVIAEFTMPLLAVMALAKFLGNGDDKEADAKGEKAKDNKKSQLVALYISFGFCALLCLIGIFAPSVYGSAITSQDTQTVVQLIEAYPDYGFQADKIYAVLTDLRYGMLRDDCWRSLFILVFGFSLLWMAKNRNLNRAVVLAGVGALVLFDLYNVDKRYVSSECFATVRQTANPLAADEIDKAILKDTDPSYRVMDIPGFGAAGRSYHHKMIGGYHAAKLNRYEDLIQRRMVYLLQLPQIAKSLGTENVRDVIELATLPDSVLSQYPPQIQELANEIGADLRVLDMLNARYIITGDKDQPLIINPDALGNAWLVEQVNYVDNADAEMEALSTLEPSLEAVADKKFEQVLGQVESAPLPTDMIELTKYTPNQLTYKVDTSNGGVAVFSEVYFPWGWKATIDGTEAPLARVNYVLRALKVPAGEHEIVMTFDPASLHTTGAVAYASVTMIYLWLLLAIGFVCYNRRLCGKKEQ